MGQAGSSRWARDQDGRPCIIRASRCGRRTLRGVVRDELEHPGVLGVADLPGRAGGVIGVEGQQRQAGLAVGKAEERADAATSGAVEGRASRSASACSAATARTTVPGPQRVAPLGSHPHLVAVRLQRRHRGLEPHLESRRQVAREGGHALGEGEPPFTSGEGLRLAGLAGAVHRGGPARQRRGRHRCQRRQEGGVAPVEEGRAVVDPLAVEPAGGAPSAHAAGPLEQQHPATAVGQRPGAGESRDASAHDQDRRLRQVGHVGTLHRCRRACAASRG